MTIISYAQNFEDVMLWRALSHVECGFYIDVGACSPQADSVTHLFYQNGWSGINVEPNPEYFAELKTDRARDINLEIALSDENTTSKINIFEATGLSTLDASIAEGHEASGRAFRQIEVSVRTLADVWAEHVEAGRDVHFLKIDVEGFEETVIRGNDWTQYRPWVLVIEATMPMSTTEIHDTWEPLLLDADYQLAYVDGLNRFYVASEHSELLKSLKYPPNVFDEFITFDLQNALERAQSAESILATYHARAADAEARIAALYRSGSWRITAPLRRLMDIFTRFRH